MSLTLHLGVLDQPYRGARKATTTADVAKFLEERYGLIGTYSRVHGTFIVKAMENSIQGALETLLMGGPSTDPWARAGDMIQQDFKEFISSREAERVGIPGTPTKAALRGVNHRFKHPYAKRNPRRPSFRDTGLYMNSFRAWMTTK